MLESQPIGQAEVSFFERSGFQMPFLCDLLMQMMQALMFVIMCISQVFLDDGFQYYSTESVLLLDGSMRVDI